MSRRVFLIVFGIGLTTIFGWLIIDTLNRDYCTNLPQAECYILWVTAIASVLGGTLLAEMWMGRPKVYKKSEPLAQGIQNDGKTLIDWRVWFRPVAWVTLVIVLSGLPLIAKGAFGVTVFGILAGLSLAFVIRGVMNRLPSFEEDNKI